MGKIDQIKEINEVLNFLDGIGAEGATMAKFLRRNKHIIVKESPIYFIEFKQKNIAKIESLALNQFENFLSEHDLTPYYDELRLFYSVCYFSLDLHHWRVDRIKRQTQKKIGDIDHYPNLTKDLKAIKDVNLDQYISKHLINSIDVNIGKNESYKIRSEFITGRLESELIEVIREWLQNFDVNNPPAPPKPTDFARKYLLPIYRFIEKKHPHHGQKKHCNIIMDFWSLFYDHGYNSDWFRRYTL